VYYTLRIISRETQTHRPDVDNSVFETRRLLRHAPGKPTVCNAKTPRTRRTSTYYNVTPRKRCVYPFSTLPRAAHCTIGPRFFVKRLYIVYCKFTTCAGVESSFWRAYAVHTRQLNCRGGRVPQSRHYGARARDVKCFPRANSRFQTSSAAAAVHRALLLLLLYCSSTRARRTNPVCT